MITNNIHGGDQHQKAAFWLSQDTPVVAHEPIHLVGTYKLCIRDFAILCEWNYQVGADVIHAAIFDEGLEELIEPSNLSWKDGIIPGQPWLKLLSNDWFKKLPPWAMAPLAGTPTDQPQISLFSTLTTLRLNIL